MNCKICSAKSEKLFETKVLNKYNVQYYKCTECEFIETEKPYWLQESYGNAITKLDIGLIYRNQIFCDLLQEVITNNFDDDAKFLDYGGGYGMFVRMMRDKGFDFYRQDIYCDNLFAEYFDITDLHYKKQKFEALTTFEVFEHLEDPLIEIEKMLAYSDTIIFSTELQPSKSIRNVDDWWYFIPETGQHVALYHMKALEKIAEYFKLNLYSNGVNLHMITSKKFINNPLLKTHVIAEKKQVSLFQKIIKRLIKEEKMDTLPVPIVSKESLLMKDFAYIKSLLK